MTKEEPPEGCLSPDGTFFSMPYGTHNKFLLDKYIELYAPSYKLLLSAISKFETREFPDKMVYEKGWIICGRYLDGEIIVTGKHGKWTTQQISKLRELYAENKKILHKLEYHMDGD